MNVILCIVYAALIITLGYAAYLDHRDRRVPHIVWLPLILFGAYPVVLHWLDIWPSQVLCITFVLCVLAYMMPIWFPGDPANPYTLRVGGADAIAVILVSLAKPVALGYPGMFWLLLFTCCIFLVLAIVPRIKNSWDERGIPFLVPLLPAAVLVILLPM